MAFSVLFQLYIFLSVSSSSVYRVRLTLINVTQTGSLARVEAIITSLVFDHALRIRLKAEASESKSGSATASAANSTPGSPKDQTQEPASADDDDDETIHSRSATAASTTTTATAATSSTATAVSPKSSQSNSVDAKKSGSVPPAQTAQTKKSNVVGKINNLVTSDLDNITRGRDFLFLCTCFVTVLWST